MKKRPLTYPYLGDKNSVQQVFLDLNSLKQVFLDPIQNGVLTKLAQNKIAR